MFNVRRRDLLHCPIKRCGLLRRRAEDSRACMLCACAACPRARAQEALLPRDDPRRPKGPLLPAVGGGRAPAGGASAARLGKQRVAGGGTSGHGSDHCSVGRMVPCLIGGRVRAFLQQSGRWGWSKSWASSGNVASFDALLPSIASLSRVSRSNPQRGPGASRPPESAPSLRVAQVSPVLVRIGARKGVFVWDSQYWHGLWQASRRLAELDTTELILGVARGWASLGVRCVDRAHKRDGTEAVKNGARGGQLIS